MAWQAGTWAWGAGGICRLELLGSAMLPPPALARRLLLHFPLSLRTATQVDVDVYRSLGPKRAEPLPGCSSFFQEGLAKWRELCSAEHWLAAAQALQPLSQSLPQLVHHRDDVVGILLGVLRMHAKLSLEPVLELLGTLARDLQADYLPALPRVLAALSDLVDAGEVWWRPMCMDMWRDVWRSSMMDGGKLTFELGHTPRPLLQPPAHRSLQGWTASRSFCSTCSPASPSSASTCASCWPPRSSCCSCSEPPSACATTVRSTCGRWRPSRLGSCSGTLCGAVPCCGAVSCCLMGLLLVFIAGHMLSPASSYMHAPCRQAPGPAIRVGVKAALAEAVTRPNDERVHAAGALLAEAVTGVSNGLHSRTSAVLEPVLREDVLRPEDFKSAKVRVWSGELFAGGWWLCFCHRRCCCWC